MADHDWKQHFWRNTVSNYLRTILRLASGLVLFRLTFQQLTAEQFGFYSLLWSLFGYTILLDFGLGFTAQKAVAEKTATGRIDELNELISTIFWTFFATGVMLLIGFLAGRPFFLEWTKVSPANLATFSSAYLMFVAGMACAFPFGIFPEMLRGLQRIDLANWISIGATLVNLVLLGGALLAGWSFPTIVLISVATTVAPNLIAWFLVRPRIPGLSLHPRHFRLRAIHGVLSFSLVAYLITFTNLIMSRTDQAVIGFTIGVSFVALYQAGYKVSEMFGMFSVQMQDALTPAAARLNIQGDRGGLRHLLLRSTQLTLLLTIPLYSLSAAYLEPLIRTLTGLKAIEPATYWIGEALLLATFSSLVTNSCSKRILMMCGWEKKLLVLSLVDAGANLVLSLWLVYPLGVLGVAIGTLIPTVLIGWLWVLPLTARFAEASIGSYLRQTFGPVAVPVLAGMAVLGALLWLAPMPADGKFIDCAWRGLLVVGPVAALGWRQVRNLRGPA